MTGFEFLLVYELASTVLMFSLYFYLTTKIQYQITLSDTLIMVFLSSLPIVKEVTFLALLSKIIGDNASDVVLWKRK